MRVGDGDQLHARPAGDVESMDPADAPCADYRNSHALDSLSEAKGRDFRIRFFVECKFPLIWF